MLTLNLLPPEKRREAAFRRYFYPVKTALELLLITALVLAIVTVGLKLFLLNAFLETATSPQVNVRVRELETAARITNRNTALFLRLDGEDTPWSPLLRALAEQTPKTIRVTELTIQRNTPPHLTLKGTAETRNALLAWKTALEKLPMFSKLSFPLTNLLVAEETPWQLEAEINFKTLRTL